MLELTFFIHCFYEFPRDREKLVEMFPNFLVLMSKEQFWIKDEGGVVRDIMHNTGWGIAQGH